MLRAADWAGGQGQGEQRRQGKDERPLPQSSVGGGRQRARQRRVEHAPGAERQGEVGAESVVPWRITVRGARGRDPRRPRPEQRFRMGERVFCIEAVAEAGKAGLWLDCLAREERLS